MTVSTAADLIAAIKATGPRVVRVQGMITVPAGMHDVSSDKTIIGVGAASGITGGGLNVGLPVSETTTPPADAVHNVIIRNLVFRNATDDSINVQMFSHHVWIDHNDLSDGYDGAIDIKRGLDRATKAAVEGKVQVKIHTPLIQMTKAEIIKQGSELGLDYSLTWSCYDPTVDGKACALCDSCQLRLKGFKEAGLRDPIPYATTAG